MATQAPAAPHNAPHADQAPAVPVDIHHAMTGQEIQSLVHNQREHFRSHATLPITFRIAQLQKLRGLLHQHEEELYAAIEHDFGKSRHLTQMTELSPIYHEIDLAIKHLRKWAKPRRARTNRMNLPAKSYIVPEPLGVSLVIGAWNFPYNLSLIPVVGSMMAGNTTVLKPSELPAETSRVMAKIINNNFDPSYLHVVEGGVPETTALLEQRWNKVFFTGSSQVGKIVNQAAAPHLTDVTLELGGKNPVIFDKDASIDIGVKRMIWGAFLNAGQLCLAPDYVLVHKSIKDRVLQRMVHELKKHDYSVENGNFVRLINERNFDRVASLVDPAKVYYGGKMDREQRVIEPTILHNVTLDDAVMQEEIFGPVIAVIEYETLDDAFELIHGFEKPLAAYLFSNSKQTKQRFLAEIPFGSGAINDVVMQVSNSHLPFGGVGNSGVGSYHGKYSFECFSHMKPILEKPNLIEFNLKYYGLNDRKMKWMKRLS